MSVDEIFSAALVEGPEHRAALLDRMCDGDSSLRARVERLLACHDRAADFLEQPATPIQPSAFGSQLSAVHEAPLPAGTLLGRYRIVREIGAGGMGTVYEAVQEHPRRSVALKVIRPGAISRAARRRFEIEVEVLGRLQHPGIAQIYEAGTAELAAGPRILSRIRVLGESTPLHQATEKGFSVEQDGTEKGFSVQQVVPFFAMELVRGPALLEFARRCELSTRDQLELFAKICDAVEHAHQKGVIHRDLKPANILVVDEGTEARRHEGTKGETQSTHSLRASVPSSLRASPKILDFGIARATDCDITATLDTAVGQIVGTIAYMSPEQVSGDPAQIDTRSDVYSLGVVLFELLCGRRPYDVENRSLPEALRVVRGKDPTHLSSIHPAFRGDLDTLVAKAIEKDRTRRYQSASELATDIRRHLRDEPIVARPATVTYQLHKFARRNKALVGGVVTAFILLIAGIIGTGRGMIAAREAQQAAEVNQYVANIGAAEAALRANDVSRARQQLNAAPAHLRDWEWHHLHGRLDHSRLTLAGHDYEVQCVRYSPDGRLVASSDRSGLIKLWDIVAGRELATLRGHAGEIKSLSFSPNGAILTSGSDDHSIRLWDVARSVQIVALLGQERPIVQWSPDQKLLASGDWDGGIVLWDPETHERVADFNGHQDKLNDLHFSLDSSRLVSTSWDSVVCLWDVAARREIARWVCGGKKSMHNTALSRDGRALCAGFNDGGIVYLDLVPGSVPQHRKGSEPNPLLDVEFIDDGNKIVGSCGDGSVRMWDAHSGDPLSIFLGHGRRTRTLSLSPNGRHIVSGSDDGTVKVWTWDTEDIRTLRGHRAWVYSVQFSPNGKLLASYGTDFPEREFTVRMWDLATGGQIWQSPACDRPRWQVAFSPDGKALAIQQSAVQIALFEPETGRLLRSLDVEAGNGWYEFSPDGRVLAVTNENGNIELKRVDGGSESRVVRAHARHFFLQYSSDGSLLAISPREQPGVHLIDAHSGQVVQSLYGPTDNAHEFRFGSDGSQLVIVGEDGTMQLWSLQDTKLIWSVVGHRGIRHGAAFIPGTKRLVTYTDNDSDLKFWDTESGREIASLQNPGGPMCLDVSADGAHLATGGQDRVVRVWDRGSLAGQP